MILMKQNLITYIVKVKNVTAKKFPQDIVMLKRRKNVEIDISMVI